MALWAISGHFGELWHSSPPFWLTFGHFEANSGRFRSCFCAFVAILGHFEDFGGHLAQTLTVVGHFGERK